MALDVFKKKEKKEQISIRLVSDNVSHCWDSICYYISIYTIYLASPFRIKYETNLKSAAVIKVCFVLFWEHNKTKFNGNKQNAEVKVAILALKNILHFTCHNSNPCFVVLFFHYPYIDMQILIYSRRITSSWLLVCQPVNSRIRWFSSDQDVCILKCF